MYRSLFHDKECRLLQVQYISSNADFSVHRNRKICLHRQAKKLMTNDDHHQTMCIAEGYLNPSF